MIAFLFKIGKSPHCNWGEYGVDVKPSLTVKVTCNGMFLACFAAGWRALPLRKRIVGKKTFERRTASSQSLFSK